MVNIVIDIFGLAIFAVLFFMLGVFAAYGIMRERMKLRAWERAQRDAWMLFTNMYRRERELLEREIAREYEEKLEEWKREFIEKLKSKIPNLNVEELMEKEEKSN